jgi:hypothetical protein
MTGIGIRTRKACDIVFSASHRSSQNPEPFPDVLLAVSNSTAVGPEAWDTVTGETCLETPDGSQVGRAGGKFVIVPGGPPMHLIATGKEQRQALALILHDSTKPATTLVSDWTPKGLCKN